MSPSRRLCGAIIVSALLAACGQATSPSGSPGATSSSAVAVSQSPATTPTPAVPASPISSNQSPSPIASPSPAITPMPSSAVTPPPNATPVVSPAPSPSSGATPPAAGDATWHWAGGPPLHQLHQAYEAAWTGTEFVLAGIVERVVPDRSEGIAFWTSPDGADWSMGEERSAGWVRDFAFDESGSGVAVGFLGSAMAAWSSEDGVRWTGVPEQSAFLPRASEPALEMYGVAHADAGFVGLAEPQSTSGKAILLVSDDGLRWTRLPADPAFSGVRLDDIAGRDGRFVLVGHVRSPYRNILWTSSDGRTWSEVLVTSDVDVTDISTGTYQVAAGPAGWLLTLSGSDSQPGRAWWSADGVSWAAATAPSGARLEDTIASPSGFVAVAQSSGCAPGLWTSADALAWSCVGGDPVGLPGWGTSALAASKDAIVTVRSEVWVAQLSD